MPSSPVIIFFLLLLSNGIAAKLSSPEFYSRSCPHALTKIKLAVNLAVLNESRIGASLLRLHFHNCFVNGCDASILLDDTPSLKGEKKAFSNVNSMRGYEIIDLIKSQLEHLCPTVVSCADILAVAARDSVVALGGPSWSVQLGRRDSTTASLVAANRDLPDHSSNLTTLLSSFSSKGSTAQEMVALSGAHTIGKAKCKSFRNRVYNEKNINSAFAYWVRANCPLNGGDKNLSPLDGSSSTFDNTYFKYIKNSMGLLHSDQQLYNRGSTDYLVHTYSNNTTAFFSDFANAMIKMGSLAQITESVAEIRTSCRQTNWPMSYDY